jgi:hypothetical protein
MLVSERFDERSNMQGFIDIRIYEEVMKQFIQAYTFLEGVSFQGCRGGVVSNDNMKFLIEKMPNLKLLDLRCTDVDEKQIFASIISKPQLICKMGYDSDEKELPSGSLEVGSLLNFSRKRGWERSQKICGVANSESEIEEFLGRNQSSRPV